MSEEKRFHARLFWLQSAARKIFIGHRVSACCRVTVPQRKVEIWGDVKQKRAKYRNVIRCASVWHCPVCANNVTAHRRDELQTVIAAFREITIPTMISFTVRHARKDSLLDTMTTVLEAWRDMTSRRAWANMKESGQLRGYVRSLEITWGQANGWHPHIHCLFFFALGTNIAEEYNNIRHWWEHNVSRAGGDTVWEYATSMSTTDESVAGYMAKWGHEPSEETRKRLSNWGQAQEVTRGGQKQGRKGHITPFDMLELFLQNGQYGPSYWATLLREYCEAMIGQRQITWSRNPDLRREAGIKKDLSDNEVVEGSEAGYYLLATIEPEQWTAILWAGCQGVILDCAARGDNDMMQGIITDCQTEHIESMKRHR